MSPRLVGMGNSALFQVGSAAILHALIDVGRMQKWWRRKQAPTPAMSISKETPLGGLDCNHPPEPPPKPQHMGENPV